MSKKMITRVPNRPDIELVEFYSNFEWYYPNCELETKDWIVKNAAPDWVYFDCGANIGYYSILFSQISPDGQVHAIEPTATIEMLKNNLEYNHSNNVITHNLALSQYPGSRIDKIYRIWGEESEVNEYYFTNIDCLVTQLKIKKLDCIKIDVDSYDFEVLKGGEQALIEFDPWVIIELSNNLSLRNSNVIEVLTWLRDRGYNSTSVYDNENYIFKRKKEVINQHEIPIDLVIWLYERDILFDVVKSLHKNESRGVAWTDHSYATECVLSSAHTSLKEKFNNLNFDELKYPKSRCFQFGAVARHFNPDCILQFGRWSGKYTYSLILGMSDSDDWELWSYCKTDAYFRKNLDDSKKVHIRFGYPKNTELKNITDRAKRILLFWDDVSVEAGNIILNDVLPLIQHKDNIVILQGIWDGRFKTLPEYIGDGSNVMVIGNTWSPRDDLVRILDFVNRNNLQMFSYENALRRLIETNRNQANELEQSLGSLYTTLAGWHWISLNGSFTPITFPSTKPPTS